MIRVDPLGVNSIEPSITLMNYPNNCLDSNFKIIQKNIIYFFVFILVNKKWKKIYSRSVPFGSFINLKRSDLNIKDTDMAVIVPSKTDITNETFIKLPKPHSLRLDQCPIEERASYNFSFFDKTASYQGDYPYQMTKIEKGSFFTFDSLRLDMNKNSFTYLVLTNLNIKSNSQLEHVFDFYNPENMEVIEELKVKSNCSQAILMNKDFFKIKPIFLSCKTASFIPLFISIKISSDNKEINVEHTHPPTELFWGIDKNIAVKNLKKRWVLK